MVDAGGFAPIGLGLVRVLRHLGPAPRRLLRNHQSVSSPLSALLLLFILLASVLLVVWIHHVRREICGAIERFAAALMFTSR